MKRRQKLFRQINNICTYLSGIDQGVACNSEKKITLVAKYYRESTPPSNVMYMHTYMLYVIHTTYKQHFTLHIQTGILLWIINLVHKVEPHRMRDL